MAVSTIGQRVTLKYERRPTPTCNPQAIDWTFAIDAPRSGDEEGVTKVRTLIEGNKLVELEGPPNPSNQGDSQKGLDLTDACWKDKDVWTTDFPPPAGFSGDESRP